MARLPLRAVQCEGLLSTPSRVAAEKASMTFVLGAVLVNNAGYLEEAGANPRVVVGVAEEPGENGATDGAKTVRYVPALPHVVFEASFDKASGLGTVAPAQADLFAEYGLTEDASGVWYVDVDKTTGGTNTLARIVEIDAGQIGVTQGRVRFIFLAEATVYHT